MKKFKPGDVVIFTGNDEWDMSMKLEVIGYFPNSNKVHVKVKSRFTGTTWTSAFEENVLEFESIANSPLVKALK